MTSRTAVPAPRLNPNDRVRLRQAEKDAFLDEWADRKSSETLVRAFRDLCRKEHLPFIRIMRQGKWARVTADGNTIARTGWEARLSTSEFESICAYIHDMPGRDKKSVAMAGTLYLTVSHIVYEFARSLAREFLKAFKPARLREHCFRCDGSYNDKRYWGPGVIPLDYKAKGTIGDPDSSIPYMVCAADITPPPSKGSHKMREATVEFIEDEATASTGVLTDAETAEAFLSTCAAALAGKIREDGGGDWETRLSYWLPQIVEVACKLKGYKADVKEKRVISSGDFSPAAFARAMQAGPGLVLPLPGSNGNARKADGQ